MAGPGGHPGELDKTVLEDWQWVLDVYLMGVVYGAQTMIPLIKQHGEGGLQMNWLRKQA
jgi:NADP-dependent 3-hydroxy acid dehydrogenase YdfG